jgi:hypothetical protein|tara:strand:+ start:1933 stop:3801 length:1869 start_codon:yes stop_codon:yes gene_type:complete
MPLSKLQFKPGINREGTNYSNEGGWFDGDKIRFRAGYPESIGGWTRVSNTQVTGTPRKIFDFVTLASQNLLFIGTEKKVLLENAGTFNDITPVRSTVSLGADPVNTTGGAGSGVVTVTTQAAHGAITGDFVTLASLTATDGITTGQLNKEHEITSVPSTTTFTIDTGGSASSGSTAGGGSSGTAAFQINVGLNTTVLGSGWGAGTWGRFTWGSAAGSLSGQTLRLFSVDNFGEDLIFNISDGSIFYWDATNGTSTRAVALTSLTGASDVPTVARKVLVSDVDRHVIIFGCNPIGSAVLDPLLIRFGSQESVTDFTPTATNTAGDLRLSKGSEIITAVQTSRQILVFTDQSLYSMQFIGAPFTFGVSLLGDNIRIAGPNTAIAVNDVVFWMGQENFYLYDGRIQAIPCTVRDYVFNDMNNQQSFKFHAGSIGSQTEIWWFYCSSSATEIDRYVVYNYGQQVWYYGTLVRTAWNDRASGLRSFPQATGADFYLYDHEDGEDDFSTGSAVAINAFVESSDFDIGDGQQFMLVNRILPDITFDGSSTGSPVAKFTVKSRDFSGNNFTESPSGSAVRTATSPVEQFTNKIDLRARGRQMAIRVEKDAVGVKWRLGAPRLDARADGRR